MTVKEQLELWVAGKSVHNPTRDECCPDFSCCQPELQADKETREVFVRADENSQKEMLMMFLGGAFYHSAKLKGKTVYIVGTQEGTKQ